MLRQSIQRIDQLLNSQASDKEFERQLENYRLLRDCKAKGFKELEGQGLIAKIANNRKTKYNYFRVTDDKIAIAKKGAKLINEGFLSMTKAAQEIGIDPETLRGYISGCKVPIITQGERKARIKKAKEEERQKTIAKRQARAKNRKARK